MVSDVGNGVRYDYLLHRLLRIVPINTAIRVITARLGDVQSRASIYRGNLQPYTVLGQERTCPQGEDEQITPAVLVDQLVPGDPIGKQKHEIVQLTDPPLDGPAIGQHRRQLLLGQRPLVPENRKAMVWMLQDH